MSLRVLRSVALLSLLFLSRLGAADPKPMVGPGATKDEVIDAYGWPTGQSQSGRREVLTYPQGKVMLESGRVERIDFSLTMPWPAPKPRPGSVAAASPSGATTESFWLGDFERACQEAGRRNARVLALFTGSDWSQASRQFRQQVALDPEFINAFTGDFVFLEVDFPLRAPQPEQQRQQNDTLRRRFEVSIYPTLLVISPAGAVLGRVDLEKLQPGGTYRDRVMVAVREVRELLAVPPPPPAKTDDPVVTATPAAAGPNPGTEQLANAVRSARWVVALGIVAGVATAAFLLWLVWRQRAPQTAEHATAMVGRIADAANGLPAQTELLRWPRHKLCALVSGLAESEGYAVEPRPDAADVDLALRRGDDTRPRVLVSCVAGASAPVSAKRVCELLASMTAEAAGTGWIVAPGGFSAEARARAGENGIVLLSGENLAEQLRELPPFLLPKVLARVARAPV